MFPRLHVNDTDKGEPKEPPRNKMALYEHFSIPSQRCASGSASSFPAPPSNNNNIHQVPSLIPSDGSEFCFSKFCPIPDIFQFGNVKLFLSAQNTISSYQKSISIQPPLQSADKFPADPSREVALNTNVRTNELKARQPASNNSLFNGSLPMTSKCESFRPHNLPNLKTFPFDKIGVTDDLVVPNAGPGKYSGNSHSQHNKDGVKHPHLSVSYSLKIQSVIGKKTNPAGTIQLKLKQLGKNHNWKSCQIDRDPEQVSAYPFYDGDISDASSQLSLEVKSPLKQVHESSDHEMGNMSVNNLKSSEGGNDQKIEVYLGRDDKLALTDDLFGEASMNSVSRSPDEKETSTHFEDKRNEYKTSQLDMHNHQVIRMIGEKHFWEARGAIINQQRIFIMQLFELHRVVKIQRLFAGSPQLLRKGSLFLGKFSSLDSEEKRSPSENVKTSPAFTSRTPDEPMDPDYSDYNTATKLQFPSAENRREVHIVPQFIHEHHAKKSPLAPTANHCKQSPWNLQNQWLVPYMSPSEGLVYKPFSGPCPPTAGLIPPFYGSCGPVKLNSGNSENVDASYGFSATHHGIDILSGTPLGKFYPPCHIPPLNASMTGSEVEQVCPFHEMQANENANHQLTGNNHGILPCQRSCKYSSKMSQVISGDNENHNSYEETELAITDSIQSDRMKRKVLPLFPTTPTLKASCDDNVELQLARVIKGQPHNPRSASESVARIFKRMQEEKRYSE